MVERRATSDSDVDGVDSGALPCYSAVADLTDGVAYRLDADGRFVAVDDGLLELTGRVREELLGERVSSLVSEGERRRVERAVAERLAAGGGGREAVGAAVRTADGETIPCELRVSPLFDDDECRGAVGVVREVGDRSDADGDGRSRRERRLEQYRALVEVASDVVVTVDEDSTIRTVNPAVEEVFGYEPAELEGRPLAKLLPEHVHREALERSPRTGDRNADRGYVELTGRRADGTEIPLTASFDEVEHGGERFFAGIVRDVTERTGRERKLEHKERRYEAVFEDPNILVGLLDPEGTVLDINETAMEYVEAGLEDVTGEPFWETPWWGEGDDVGDDVREWTERAAAGEYVDFETDLTRPDGRRYTLIGYFRPVTNDDGDVVSIIVSDRDVTERKRRERELEESNERLEQFAYAASHDLQEPLRMVSSYVQLVDSRYGDQLDEEGREFLEYAVDGADRMREMIDGLLEYSRVETRGDPLEPVDLDAVLENVLADLQFSIADADAEIVADPLPRVEGDPSQLRQLFQNLLANAIEYSGDGSPRVRVEAERGAPGWDVSISDEGIGIDPADQERIFEVFQRLHGREEGGGTGIGLALCERIVERHGGEIRVDSEPGEGATFSFTLPAADES